MASNRVTTSENSNTETGGNAGRSFLYPFRIDQINHQNNKDFEEALKDKLLLKNRIDRLNTTRKLHQSKLSLEHQFHIFENGSNLTTSIFKLYIESVLELLREGIVNK